MKRIAITLAALAVSSIAFADSENLFNVDGDYQVHAYVEDSKPMQNTNRTPRAEERGLSQEISVGSTENLFDVDADDDNL